MTNFGFHQVSAQQLVRVEYSIIIKSDKAYLFDFVADVLNDHKWREQVDSMVIVDSEIYGKGATEYLRVNKKKQNITTTYITEQTDSSITFTTPDTDEYYFQARRTVLQMDDEQCLFTTLFEFDNNITKKVAPFRIPKWMTKLATKSTLKKEMKALKKLIEKAHNKT